jgi:SAM-dependent methyltransferase
MTVPPGKTSFADPGNADQARAWNSADGDDWVVDADRYDAASGRYDPRLVARAEIAAADRVLDVGCGAGISTRAAARIAVDGHVTGVDLSDQLVDEARRRSAAAGLINTTFVRADAQVHPFEPAAFDVVISRFGVMFFGDPVAAFANIARAVRPGGRLALLSWQELARNEWLQVLRESFAAGRVLPDPPSGVPGPFGLADPDDVRRVLNSAGFVDVGLEDVREPVYLGADRDDAVDFAGRLGLARGLLGGLDEHVRRTALEALRTRLAAAETPDGVLLGSAAWLITARRP